MSSAVRATRSSGAPQKVLFLHGWPSDGATKTSFLWSLGYAVRAPKLSNRTFGAALITAQSAFDEFKPDVIVGSSRGGAVGMAMLRPDTPLVLLAPAWRFCGVRPRVEPTEAVVIHSPSDRWVPIQDSVELWFWNPFLRLVRAGRDHRLNDPDARAALTDVLGELLPESNLPNCPSTDDCGRQQ